MGRRSKSMIRAGSRAIEKEMIKRAERLIKDPGVMVPKCQGKCLLCPFKSLRPALEKVASKADDENALIRLSKHGDPIVMAFAALLLVRLRRKVPYMANQKVPDVGTVAYVMWGKASKEKLIGIQHFDNPVLRLMAYYDIARKKGIYIYSMFNGLICTGKSPVMPDGFLKETLVSHPVRFKGPKDGIYACEHAGKSRTMALSVLSSGERVEICSKCAGRFEGKNTLHIIIQRIAGPDPTKDFSVDFDYHIKCMGTGKCSLSTLGVEDWEPYEDYKAGAIDDRTLFTRYHKDLFIPFIKKNNLYVIGNTCYESDAQAFLRAVGGGRLVLKALKRALKIYGKGLYLERPSANRMFGLVWDTHAKAIISAVVKDRGVAKEVAEMDGLSPIEALKYAVVLEKQKTLLKDYPRIKLTSPVLRLADGVFRFYKVGAMEEMDEFLDHFDTQGNLRAKALKYAFAAALDLNVERHGWACTPEEKEFGDFLVPYVHNLLEATEDTYVQKLEALISVTASGDKVEVE